jgi:prepilin-type processing-associated H-X9-DG protein/prepilin-type N-terminal cleavage/methylation domain-containing protein
MRLYRSHRRGFTMVEVLMVTGIMSALGGNSFQNVTNKAYQTQCLNNLRQIFMGFQMQAANDEPLPQAWFYPPDPPHPQRDRYNLVNLMAGHGVPRQLFICPSAPTEIKQRGCCYLYNDRLSNINLDNLPNPSQTWLMMDVNAIHGEIIPSHNGGCHILYGDGHVKWTPISNIPVIMRQATDYRAE